VSAANPENVVCQGGPRDGYWYSGKHWAASLGVERHTMSTLAATGEPATASTYLGYRVTADVRANPQDSRVTGNVAIWDPQ
jgi:hypothetical protein